MEILRSRAVHFLVLDVHASGVVALDLIRYAAQLHPAPIVIPVAPASEREQVVPLLEAGAFDALERPLEPTLLRLMVHKALRQLTSVRETRRLRDDVQSREGYRGIVGRSSGMERLREDLVRLSANDASVWLWGEIGTGKELVARSLHGQGERSARAFLTVACAGAGTQNWESRLGVDTDGRPVPDGPLAKLDGGTLYLEDLPALTPDSQSRLLGTLTAPGSGLGNTRVLASSSANPERLVEQGRLLEGLFALLATERIELPSLRDRMEDVPLLARYFISSICTINHLPPIQLEGEALSALERHHWPDNVQGLRNVLEQAVILCPDGKVRLRDLPGSLRESAGLPAAPAGPSAVAVNRRFRDAKREIVEAFERSYLGELMELHRGNVTAASQQAGMLRSALQRLLRKYGLKSASFRRQHPSNSAGDSTRQ